MEKSHKLDKLTGEILSIVRGGKGNLDVSGGRMACCIERSRSGEE